MADMVTSIFLIIVGLVLLVKGAGWLVDGSVAIARSIGISDLIIGLTIVSLGTSAPELLVNLVAILQGNTELALGNVVGSNIANILLILGCAACVTPLGVAPSTVFKEIPFSLLAAVVLAVLMSDRVLNGAPVDLLTRGDGLVLMSFLPVFFYYLVGISKQQSSSVSPEDQPSPEVQPEKKGTALKSSALIVLGLVLLCAGGEAVVRGAVSLATSLGVSEKLVALTIVAIGTSLPELVTSVVAALRGNADIAIGNVVGSNIFNTFWILGISAFLSPLPVSPDLFADIGVMILATGLLIFLIQKGAPWQRMFFWRQVTGHVIVRWEGALLLSLYVGYLSFLIMREFSSKTIPA
jgi:cation:H+ antiporter